MIITVTLAVLVALSITLLLSGKYHIIKNTAITVTIAALVSGVISLLVLSGNFWDTEIWNGSVTNKTRVHGSYVNSYQCNCTTNKDGFTTCQTCYEDRYTVTWTAHTTVGDIQLEHLDRSSRSVYRTKDPKQYAECVIGEPASVSKRFANFVLGSPDSLYNDYDRSRNFDIPNYPRIHGYYKINRVVGLQSEATKKLNNQLNEHLITLGADKQVNIVVVVTDDIDPMYKFAVEGEWIGGKKNDVVVVLSQGEGSFNWIDAFTFANNYGNELFITMLTRDLRSIEGLDYEQVGNVIVSNITEYFDRPSMSQFEYLKHENKLKFWQMFLIILFAGALAPTITYKIDN